MGGLITSIRLCLDMRKYNVYGIKCVSLLLVFLSLMYSTSLSRFAAPAAPVYIVM